MTLFFTTCLLAMAAVAWSDPANITSHQQAPTVPIQSVAMRPMGRADSDQVYDAQGRANTAYSNSLEDALGLMSNVLAPRFMQPPNGAGASQPAAAAAPQATPNTILNQVGQPMTTLQQQPQTHPMAGAFPAQQPQTAFAGQMQPHMQQQVPFGQAAAYYPQQMDARMTMPVGGNGYLGGMGQLPQQMPLYTGTGQGLLGRSLPSQPQQPTAQFGASPQTTTFQQQPSNLNGQVQNTLPAFNNGQQFANQQPTTFSQG